MSNSNWTKIPTSEEKREIKRKRIEERDKRDNVYYESWANTWYKCKQRSAGYTTENAGMDAVNNYLDMRSLEKRLWW